MKFTITICTYNGEKTVSQALDAILALDRFEELISEVYVVDNASTDCTKDIVMKYCSDNSKILYIYEPNPGLSNARRYAINANGEWVIYVDDDNLLCTWWLTKLKELIEAHPQVGVINGAVIAIPTDELTEHEEARLDLMYRNLACTHIRSIEFFAQENREPIGAGMCIRTDALKKVDEQGWLMLTGRTGNNLASGEDTELCQKIFELGYRYLCSYEIQLDHLIPKTRLTAEYIDRLLTGLVKSRYQLISQKRFYIVQRLLRYLKYQVQLIVTRKKFFMSGVEYERYHQSRVCAKTFINCVCEDKLFFRR